MDWESFVEQVIERNWTFTVKPAYFADDTSGHVVELLEFDPRGTEKVHREIVRFAHGEDQSQRVIETAIDLARKIDADFY